MNINKTLMNTGNNGLHEVVTSIYFVKIKTKFCKIPWIPTQASSSFLDLQFYALITELLGNYV